MSRAKFIRWLPLLASLAALAETGLPYKREPEIERIGVGCAPNPTDYRIASAAELTRLLQAWDRECGRDDTSKQRKAIFTRALEKAGIDFERETLFIIGGMYGTGMARASLELAADGGVVTAGVTWRVPPPPVTPDTTTYRFAFRVDKKVSQVRVTVDGRERVRLPVSP